MAKGPGERRGDGPERKRDGGGGWGGPKTGGKRGEGAIVGGRLGE